jgi:hypothetical protein
MNNLYLDILKIGRNYISKQLLRSTLRKEVSKLGYELTNIEVSKLIEYSLQECFSSTYGKTDNFMIMNILLILMLISNY